MLSKLTTVTFQRIYPSPGSAQVYAPSRIVDRRQHGLVTFIWNVPVPIDIPYINWRITQENQVRTSTGNFLVWSPNEPIAVEVTFTPRTNYGAETPVTVRGILIDLDGRTYSRLESPRTVQLLIANRLIFPSYATYATVDL